MLNINWLTATTELLLVFVVTSVLILYFQYRQRYGYWKRLGINQLNPIFPVGDLSWSGLGFYSVYIRLKELQHEFKRQKKAFGGVYFFNAPIFLPVDLDLIKSILATDFQYFADRGLYHDKENLPISNHLSSMKGEEWRELRSKFTPIFTSGKMRNMFGILIHNISNAIDVLNEYENGTELDMKAKCVYLLADFIGNIALGLDCNTLKNPNDQFPQMVYRIFNPTTWDLVKVIAEEGVQNPGNLMKTAYSKDVVEFFTKLVYDTIEYREKNNIVRNDFMDMLLKLKETKGLTNEDILAQVFVFFIGGYETSSSTMGNVIHEMAHNQDIQDRLRKEIIDNIGKDVTKYTYDDIQKLPYLDKIIKETLRKHPILGMLPRVVVKPYKLPGTNAVLPVGTNLVVPVLGLHRDPEYFPDPLKFDPDRFSDENIAKIRPYTYLPFGAGPRNCIGMRLAYMQMKLAICGIFSHFKFVPSKRSQRELEINPSTSAIVITVKNGVPVKIYKA